MGKGLKALVREQIIDADSSDAESAQKNWEEGNYLRLAYNVFEISLDMLCSKVGIDGDDVIQLASDTYNGKSLNEILATGGDIAIDAVCERLELGEGDDVKALGVNIMEKLRSAIAVAGWSVTEEEITAMDTAVALKLEKTFNARVVRAYVDGTWHRAVPIVQNEDIFRSYKVSYVNKTKYNKRSFADVVSNKMTKSSKLYKIRKAAKSLKQIHVPQKNIEVWDTEARKYIQVSTPRGRSLMKHLVPVPRRRLTEEDIPRSYLYTAEEVLARRRLIQGY